MRSILTSTLAFMLALGLLITLCASGQAAALHHAKARQGSVHRSQDMIRSFNRSQDAVPGFAGPARAGKPVWPPVLEDQTPSYDDPSKFGGG
jgi:hypothetical protein